MTVQTSRKTRLALIGALAASTFLANSAFAAGEATGDNPTQRTVPYVSSVSGAYLAAKAAQISGDLGVATGYFDAALRYDPESEDLQQDALFAYLADGRFKNGVDLAAKLRDDPDVGKVARIALGVDDLRRGAFDAAVEQFDLPNPSDLDALLLGHLMAWAEVGAGHVDAALERIGKLDNAQWYPTFNHYQAGLIGILTGRDDLARKELSALVDDASQAQTSTDAYLGAVEALARLEARAGNKDAAIAAVDKGLDIAATYDPLVRLKERIEKGETIEPAIASVGRGAAEVLYVLGQAINRGEGQQVALLYFQLARAIAPADDMLLNALAGVAEKAQRLDLAISYYDEIPQDSPLRRTADLQTGLDLWYAERKQEATEHLRAAVERYPQDLQAHLAFADVLSADKNYGEAAKVLDDAAKFSAPDDAGTWNLYYQRGIAHERLKQWDEAEPNFKKALELYPNQPQVLNYLGYSWVDMNRNLDEGLQMIKTAVELRPNDGYIIDSLGWAYYRLGRYDQAVEQLERAVLINPVDPTINDHLGDAYWRVGREREAKFQWQRSLVGDPKPDEDLVKTINDKLANGLPPAQSNGPQKAAADPGAAQPQDSAAVKPAEAPAQKAD
ncbi:tetratricopeptide repeat protein [Mangrovibrevibacter kandeliae]|uniref:tetratricopeptide repeat protein n=1 Tax=Mangrovibrevibacter kandeliae TaxID=2968473 RepID=UPI0021183814|nr:tetratricopeptide repeat protein [Aurantimonas sp. CSK15Z-1]MCQ8783789.1 tetratricopeptide repeat protein [Aurantimonas sp. CSK15Z-1]